MNYGTATFARAGAAEAHVSFQLAFTPTDPRWAAETERCQSVFRAAHKWIAHHWTQPKYAGLLATAAAGIDALRPDTAGLDDEATAAAWTAAVATLADTAREHAAELNCTSGIMAFLHDLGLPQ